MNVKIDFEDSIKTQKRESFKPEIQKFIGRVNDPGWKDLKKKDGIDIFWHQFEDSPIISVKGVAVVNASVKEILDFFFDISLSAPIVDVMCIILIEGKQVADLGGGHAINYSAYKMPPLISSRDFITLSFDGILENGTGLSFGKSIELDEIPHRNGFVRAVVNGAGYMYTPVEGDPSKSLVQYMVNADVKGWIPHWVINACAADQGSNVKRLQDYFAKLKK